MDGSVSGETYHVEQTTDKLYPLTTEEWSLWFTTRWGDWERTLGVFPRSDTLYRWYKIYNSYKVLKKDFLIGMIKKSDSWESHPAVSPLTPFGPLTPFCDLIYSMCLCKRAALCMV